MELLNTLIQDNFKKRKSEGFTLIEILVVIGIIGMIMAFGFIISFDSYKGYLFRTERSTVVSILERARSRALNNYYRSPHGVCYIVPNYIIFRGRITCTPTAPTDETIPANTNLLSNPLTTFPTVVFSQLTGNTTGTFTIHLEDGIKSADIIINNEGTINW